MRTIIQGGTKPDNVCIDAYDIDGDGQIDFALGADWKPSNTKSGGTLQWLKRGKTLDEPWTLYPIDTEPTVHRIRFADIDGNGKPALVLGPLMGRNATQARATGSTASPCASSPTAFPRTRPRTAGCRRCSTRACTSLHNFWPIPATGRKGMDILCASYEGVNLLQQATPASGHGTRLGDGNQDNPKGNRGASEIKQGKLKSGKKFIATIEPWHGNQVVVYTEPAKAGQQCGTATSSTTSCKWGHAVSCADLDGDGSDELIIGVRDDLSKKAGERRGVRIYKATDDRAQSGRGRSSTRRRGGRRPGRRRPRRRRPLGHRRRRPADGERADLLE